MKPLAGDTPPEVEEIWLDSVRRRGGSFQLGRLAELVRIGRQAAQVAALRAHPGASRIEIDRVLLRETYGAKAAREVVALRLQRGFYDR